MKKLLKLLSGRTFLSILLIAVQLAILVFLLFYASVFEYWYLIFTGISLLIAFFVASSNQNPAYKIAWILIIMVLPVYGGFFYLFFANRKLHKKTISQQTKKMVMHEDCEDTPDCDSSVRVALAAYDAGLTRQSDYISRVSKSPVWQHTEVAYYPLGEQFFPDFLEELKKAKKFILLEFFIISKGEMWSMVLEVLLKKLSEGVEVRLMYDDVGSMWEIPENYGTQLRKMGLEVVQFNPLRPHMNSRLNYRDHRKIAVIDGNVGFTGGVNLADEYINRIIRYGHWKDTAIRLKGDAVWNLTEMFLDLWTFSTGEDFNYHDYRPTESYATDGFVQPFGDSPLDNDNVSENAYIQIINGATDYVWIATPYLILDNEMITALKIAAQSGVDVRILTPHYPDKKYVHPVTRSYYRLLLESGVRIYEYTPGFMHAKMFVSDDKVSVVGSVNMDYRSFYLHFECGVLFYGSSVIHRVKADMEHSFELSEEMTVEQMKKEPLRKKIMGFLLRFFAPMM